MSTDPHVETPMQHTETRSRPRTGPIVWGALILAFCAYIAQRTLAPGAIEPMTWAIASIVGLGVLLLAVGVAVIVRSARARPTHPAQP